jgi:hypothetical protein
MTRPTLAVVGAGTAAFLVVWIGIALASGENGTDAIRLGAAGAAAFGGVMLVLHFVLGRNGD